MANAPENLSRLSAVRIFWLYGPIKSENLARTSDLQGHPRDTEEVLASERSSEQSKRIAAPRNSRNSRSSIILAGARRDSKPRPPVWQFRILMFFEWLITHGEGLKPRRSYKTACFMDRIVDRESMCSSAKLACEIPILKNDANVSSYITSERTTIRPKSSTEHL